MEPTARAGLIRVLLALSYATLALAGSSFPGRRGRQDCSLERCQQICEEHYGATKLDVTGRCDGDGCNCEYREHCEASTCEALCLRDHKGKEGVRGLCVGEDCSCRWN
ncbi:hypothetical protein HPB52_022248 [Rhipicephalus sanguineus]|uniref:Uncharacterized protein n=1 Tax=Rhipicephalus sanguineus TaxID=34632 RepID=A0A9D4TBU9_RHISA|nr:hypothetical protein HPB52_022248 [Rhipicephalus sanguineus]